MSAASLPSIAAELAELEQGIRDANLTRYISGAGLALLIYDHLCTFTDEVALVWAARPSVAKKLFLINRYMVLGSLLTIAYYMNQWGDNIIPDRQCQIAISFVFVYGVISFSCANFLVLLRVISLWDRNAVVVKFMLAWFLACEASSFGLMLYVLLQTIGNERYEPLVHSCVITYKSRELPVVWAASLLFDVVVLLAVVFNALYRPRTHATPLTRVLQRDGFLYFSTIAIMRLINTIIAAVARASLAIVGVFFIWAMTTTILNHSLLRIQRAALDGRERERTVSLDAQRSSASGGSGGLKAVVSKSSIGSTVEAHALAGIPMTRMSSGGNRMGGVCAHAGSNLDSKCAEDVDMEAFELPASLNADESVLLEGDILPVPAGTPWNVRFSNIGRFSP